MRELNQGHQLDLIALDTLKNHMTLQCGGNNTKVLARKWKQRGVGDMKQIQHNVAMAIWKNVLYCYTQPKQEEMDGFKMEFTRHGMKGYKAFLDEINQTTCLSIDNEDKITLDHIESGKVDLQKQRGLY